MRYDVVPLEAISLDETEDVDENVRQHFDEDLICDLADSIRDVGLLQNLIVREGDRPGTYVLKGGERRYRALHLLCKDGDWSPESGVPVMVVDGKGTFENVIENLSRVDVPPWELGHKFIVLLESGGYTQQEIAARLKKDQGYVSRMTIIARGMHPKVVAKLNKVWQKSKLSTSDLLRISALHDGSIMKRADEKAQMNLLDEILGIKKYRKRRPMKRTDPQKMARRLQHLRLNMIVPHHAKPYVDVVTKYLLGEISGRELKWPEDL